MQLINYPQQAFLWLCHHPPISGSIVVLTVILLLAKVAREKEAY